MRAQLSLRICLLVLTAALQAGCRWDYNGAWVLNNQDKDSIRKYQQFKEEGEAKRWQAESKQQFRAERVSFTGQTGSDSDFIAESERAVAQSLQPRPAMDLAAARPRPGGTSYLLEGPASAGTGSHSPMDGIGNLRKVTFASEGADFDPDLDPTGKWLVYASTQHRSTSDLYIKGVESTAVRQLTDDPANDATPVFSPDSKWIAYASDRAGNWDLYLISSDGGPSRQLTSSSDDEIYPSFSRDGRQLVYCHRASRTGQWEMAVIDLDGPATPKFIGHGLFPWFSPTEDRIVYQRGREQGSRYFGIWTIELVNGEGIRPTQIAASANAAVITPRWSPDGKKIVFCTILNPESDLHKEGRPLQSDVWVINADGSGRANLTRSRFANLQPVWSPDGMVYFVSNRGRNGMENIWAVRSEAAMELVKTAAGPAPASTAEAPVSAP